MLAGGGSRRWEGADKTRLLLGGRPLLDHVLAALPDETVVVVVGAERPTDRPVTWTREEPAGAGPAAGLQAGLAQVRGDTPVLLLAADLPRAATLVPVLLGTPLEHGARVLVDEDGRAHWTSALLSPGAADRVRGLPDLVDASLHSVFATLEVERVAAPPGALHDLDTPADLVRLEDHHERP